MMWERVQRLELQIAMLTAELDHVRGERDRARDLACRMEAELDRLAYVPYLGEAR